MIDGRRGRAKGSEVSPGGHQPDEPPELPAEIPADAAMRQSSGVGRSLAGLGVSADHVTLFGIVVAAATGLSLATGRFWVGVALLTVGGLMDTLDGAVAKAAGTSSRRGAFFDSVSDRLADAFIFAGLAWYFAAGPGHDPRLALLPVGILAVGNAISYERAKAEALGFVAKGGLMERAERLILLGLALLTHVLLVPLLWLSLALCLFTAAQRFTKVWRQASSDPAVAGGRGPATAVATSAGAGTAWRPGRVESRWRAWREANAGADRSARRRVVVTSRARSRRRDEPITTRVRRVLTSERVGGRSARSEWTWRSNRPGADRRQQGAAAAFRRRIGSGR